MEKPKIMSVRDYYGDDGAREICHLIKEGDMKAIGEAAGLMATYVGKGDILVPVPSRTGRATVTLRTYLRMPGFRHHRGKAQGKPVCSEAIGFWHTGFRSGLLHQEKDTARKTRAGGQRIRHRYYGPPGPRGRREGGRTGIRKGRH